MTQTIRKNEMDMTSGNLFKKILLYALPIVFSGLLQLLYNAADLVVCGKFGSIHSVGAISATNALINLVVQLFLGLSVGANVLMARCFGAGQKEKGQRVAYTAMILSVVMGVFIGAFGAGMARLFLEWMGTPEDVIDLSTSYLRIYFCGVPFSLIYNFGASLLRAVGDTKRPFYFLAASGIFNVLFNLLFVILFKMDVAGVALGTVLSQAISAACIVVCLLRNKGFFHFRMREMRFYKTEAAEITRIGLPAGLQGVVFALSNVLIQSSVNGLGAYTMDGNGAASSIESFVYTTMNGFAQTCIAFVSANYGANKWQNIKKIVCYCVGYACICGFVFGTAATLLGKQLLSIYISDKQAIAIGYRRLAIICLTYLIYGALDVLAFAVRGIGYSVVPMIVSVLGVCGLRIVWIYAAFPLNIFHSLEGLMISYPLSWIATVAVHLLTFVVLYGKQSKQADFLSLQTSSVAASSVAAVQETDRTETTEQKTV
ncbi:MAG: MATE family efflux transporter [Corallococcus sp.]|nr:MATE family efflux transporter [Corallococcus sp.]MCM1359984.1 MATE family efflux transporter [Corallococcus sp.]MCM1395541.1 MATE family efflux transporter [Corallococcus sp.]